MFKKRRRLLIQKRFFFSLAFYFRFIEIVVFLHKVKIIIKFSAARFIDYFESN